MVAILNQKWPPKYKNPPIWAIFGFQVEYEVLVLFVWGTFVTICVTVTNIYICFYHFFVYYLDGLKRVTWRSTKSGIARTLLIIVTPFQYTNLSVICYNFRWSLLPDKFSNNVQLTTDSW
jgi:hypothetical protein